MLLEWGPSDWKCWYCVCDLLAFSDGFQLRIWKAGWKDWSGFYLCDVGRKHLLNTILLLPLNVNPVLIKGVRQITPALKRVFWNIDGMGQKFHLWFVTYPWFKIVPLPRPKKKLSRSTRETWKPRLKLLENMYSAWKYWLKQPSEVREGWIFLHMWINAVPFKYMLNIFKIYS